MQPKPPPHLNPVAFVFLLFAVAVGALLGNAWAGLAVGCAVSLLASLL